MLTREQAVAALCVALDVPDAQAGLKLVGSLKGRVGIFKVGMELFTSSGPEIVRAINDSGGQVFLDLKFHDIPNTVEGAARSAARLGASIIDVHASGGSEMLRAAVQGAATGAQSSGARLPKILAITVLTSVDQQILKDTTGSDEPIITHVVRLARLAQDAGLDGVVASPKEVKAIRSACGPTFLIVTPGIRPAGTQHVDQKRVASPNEAIRAGANIIVIGRPITAVPDPASAADAIIAEIVGA